MAGPEENRLNSINSGLSDLEGEFGSIADLFENPFGAIGESLFAGATGLLEGAFESPFGFGGIELDIGEYLGDSLTGLLDSLLPDFLGDMFGLLGELNPMDMLNIGGGIPVLGSFGDCFRNVDDIIVETMQKKMRDFMLNTPIGMGSSALLDTTFGFMAVVGNSVNKITAAATQGVMDLIVSAQNALDSLSRTKFIAKIGEVLAKMTPHSLICLSQKLFGKAADSVAALFGLITGGLMSIDPCSALQRTEESPDVPGNSVPGCIPSGPPRPYPTVIPPSAPNTAQIALNEEAGDVRYRLGEAMSIESMAAEWGTTGDHMAANTTLQLLVRGMHNAIAAGQSPDSARATFDANVERILKEKERSAEWYKREDGVINTSDKDSPYEYFKTLSPGLADICMSDAPIIAAHAGAQDLQTANANEAWQSVGHPENPPKAETC